MIATNITLISWDNRYILTEGIPDATEIKSLEPVATDLAVLDDEEAIGTRAITLKYMSNGENLAEDMMLIADNLVQMLKEGIVKPTKVRNYSLKRA